MTPSGFRALNFTRRDENDMTATARELLNNLRERRSVRRFSSEAIPLDAVRLAIETAAQAPSGANRQPWSFVLVTRPEVKARLRQSAEEGERAFYGNPASRNWVNDLEHLGTDADKAFIEEAPALIAVFAQSVGDEGEQHYYVKESVGIACGFLVAALHLIGLATLTYTPSKMRFLGELLDRPANERPYLLIPVGYPAEGCEVPDIARKGRAEFLTEM